MPKNNLGWITLGIRPISGIHPLILIIFLIRCIGVKRQTKIYDITNGLFYGQETIY